MAVFLTDCPHCQTRQVALSIIAAAHVPGTDGDGAAVATCPICKRPVAIRFTRMGGASIDKLPGLPGTLFDHDFNFQGCWPLTVTKDAPTDIPEGVERLYSQASHNLGIGHYEAAGMAFRKALEIAVRTRTPDMPQGATLHKRIEALQLPPAMNDWAHEIRSLGNDATHEVDEFTEQDAVALAGFTEMFLRIAFTLPAQIDRRRNPQPDANAQP